jgi:hypothetical protein
MCVCAQSRVNKWGGGRGGTPGQSIISSDFKGGYRSQILSKTGGFADQTDADSASRVSLAPSRMRVTTPRGELNIYTRTGKWEGARAEPTTALTLRECCVSIIHALYFISAAAVAAAFLASNADYVPCSE